MRLATYAVAIGLLVTERMRGQSELTLASGGGSPAFSRRWMKVGARSNWLMSYICAVWTIFSQRWTPRSRATRSKTNWRRARHPFSSTSSRCTKR